MLLNPSLTRAGFLCSERGGPGLAPGHGAVRGSGGRSTQKRLFDSCIISLAPGEADDKLSWGELAGRCSCIITPSRKQYRDIYIPEGDSRAPCSSWWCGSLEPPKLEYELFPHFTREQPNARGSVPQVTYRAKQSIFILDTSVSPFIKWDNTYFIR